MSDIISLINKFFMGVALRVAHETGGFS